MRAIDLESQEDTADTDVFAAQAHIMELQIFVCSVRADKSWSGLTATQVDLGDTFAPLRERLAAGVSLGLDEKSSFVDCKKYFQQLDVFLHKPVEQPSWPRQRFLHSTSRGVPGGLHFSTSSGSDEVFCKTLVETQTSDLSS